jgi:hypothetical protein
MTTQAIDWPAWVQAVGTVLALFLTGGLAVWEAHRRRLEARGREADLLGARLAVLEFVRDQMEVFLRDHRDVRDHNVVPPMATYAALSNALSVSSSVTVLDMPSKASVQAFFVITGAVTIFREAMKLNKPDWLQVGDVIRLSSPMRAMNEAIATLHSEVRRLQAGE